MSWTQPSSAASRFRTPARSFGAGRHRRGGVKPNVQSRVCWRDARSALSQLSPFSPSRSAIISTIYSKDGVSEPVIDRLTLIANAWLQRPIESRNARSTPCTSFRVGLDSQVLRSSTRGWLMSNPSLNPEWIWGLAIIFLGTAVVRRNARTQAKEHSARS